ncbi:MAG: hypothetical protein M3512_11585 [Bacteroidota bacterium]|nr:hypothetical protein [Bacteroidota bacterium]
MTRVMEDYSENSPYNYENRTAGVFIKKISWPAVFAGLVVAVAVHVALNVLGLGIGLGAIDPMANQQPMEGLGIGSLIWYVLSMLISLFIGGWVSSRLSGIATTDSSVLHGILTWGLFTVVSLFIVTTAVGGVLSGIAGVAGGASNLAGRGMEAAAPHVADKADKLEESAADVADDVRSTLRDPETEMKARRTADDIRSALSTAAIFSFVGMLLGAGAAAWGGKIGEPKEEVATVSNK